MIIQDTEIIDENRKCQIKKIISNIPWSFRNISTTEKFPFYCYSFLQRPIYDYDYDPNNIQINGNKFLYQYFLNIINEFCYKYEIKYKGIIRCALNLTHHVKGYQYVDPHIDFSRPHLVLLIYLSDNISSHSRTLIFHKKQKYDNLKSILDVSKIHNNFLLIKKKITPEFGKILIFDGKYYHSNIIPLPGENRVVFVANLLI